MCSLDPKFSTQMFYTSFFPYEFPCTLPYKDTIHQVFEICIVHFLQIYELPSLSINTKLYSPTSHPNLSMNKYKCYYIHSWLENSKLCRFIVLVFFLGFVMVFSTIQARTLHAPNHHHHHVPCNDETNESKPISRDGSLFCWSSRPLGTQAFRSKRWWRTLSFSWALLRCFIYFF